MMMNTTMRTGGFFQDTQQPQQLQELGTMNLNGTVGTSLNSTQMGMKFKSIYGGGLQKEGMQKIIFHY